MSLQKQFTQDCPHCKTPQNLSYYSTVNVKLHPELKAKVLDGSLNAQKCSNCAKEINFRSPFLYHDMENSFMIQFNPKGKMDAVALAQVQEDLKGRGYIHREVHHYPHLIEKINTFNYGMNDLVIEKIKADLRPMLRTSLKATLGEAAEAEIHIFFEQYVKDEVNEQLSFAFFIDPSQVMGMKYQVASLSEEDRNLLFDMEALRK